jgi:hypothetical protein
MVTAFVVVLPFSFLGIPSGHDFEFHMNSWMEVLGQWKLGIIYPRWAALAHYGYGEPRFIFYPPASWTLGAILGAILPWKLVPGTFVWLVLSLSGYSMFLLARGWLARRDAIFAAALYVANPYHLVVVYWRSAFAELLGGALLPLLSKSGPANKPYRCRGMADEYPLRRDGELLARISNGHGRDSTALAANTMARRLGGAIRSRAVCLLHPPGSL